MAIEFRNTKEKLIALGAIVTLVTAFIGWNFVARPKSATAKKLEVSRRGDIEKTDIVRRIAEGETKFESYRARLAEKRESSWFIETLNEIADRAEINLSLVTPLPRVAGESFERIPLRIEMTCPYGKLGAFLEAVENHTPTIRVESLRIEGSGDPLKTADELRVSLTLAVLRPSEPL